MGSICELSLAWHCGGNQKVTVPHTSHTFPRRPKAIPVGGRDQTCIKLFTVCTKEVRFPYTEHAASGKLNPYSH